MAVGEREDYRWGEVDPDEAGRVRLIRASSVEVRAVRWLWDVTGHEGRIPIASLTLLAGREGIGKSVLATRLIADLTRGELPGCYFGTPHSAIVCATEDSRPHTLVPRLMAAGADLERVFFATAHPTCGGEDELVLPQDIGELERLIEREQAKVLLLDPLLSRLSSTIDTHRDAESRRALEPLAALAERTGIAIVGLIHLSKAATADPLTQLMGSRAFAAVARAVVYAMADPNDDATRLVGQAKSNLGSSGIPTLRYQVVGERVATTADGEDVRAGRLEWTGTDHRSIREAAQEAATLQAGSGDEASEAVLWLTDFLAEGPQASADIFREGRAASFSKSTLKRAKLKAGIGDRSQGFPRTTIWFLPASQLTTAQDRKREPTGPTESTTVYLPPSTPVSPVSPVFQGPQVGGLNGQTDHASPSGFIFDGQPV